MGKRPSAFCREMTLYSDSLIYIERHESEIPWLKIFTHRNLKEFSTCNPKEREAIWNALDIIEREMLSYYQPTKINIASFGNMLPRVHWHIMARFSDDDFFPEPMWGVRQRSSILNLPPFEPFWQKVLSAYNGASGHQSRRTSGHLERDIFCVWILT